MVTTMWIHIRCTLFKFFDLDLQDDYSIFDELYDKQRLNRVDQNSNVPPRSSPSRLSVSMLSYVSFMRYLYTVYDSDTMSEDWGNADDAVVEDDYFRPYFRRTESRSPGFLFLYFLLQNETYFQLNIQTCLVTKFYSASNT